MDKTEITKPSKEYLELVKIILEQHREIIIANKLLLQKLACPPFAIKSKAE